MSSSDTHKNPRKPRCTPTHPIIDDIRRSSKRSVFCDKSAMRRTNDLETRCISVEMDRGWRRFSWSRHVEGSPRATPGSRRDWPKSTGLERSKVRDRRIPNTPGRVGLSEPASCRTVAIIADDRVPPSSRPNSASSSGLAGPGRFRLSRSPISVARGTPLRPRTVEAKRMYHATSP